MLTNDDQRAEVEPAMADCFRHLYRVARTAHNILPVSDPRRVASESLSLLLACYRDLGVPLRRLDQICGARPGTTRMRLARHGYRTLPPSQPCYKGRLGTSRRVS